MNPPPSPDPLHSWEAFCDELKSAGKLLLRPTTPGDELVQATGARALARNIALGLQFHLENNDPLHPELLHYFDPLRKQGGDNGDALYVGAPVNGSEQYRIHGRIGSARYLAITVLEDGATPWGGKVVATLFRPDIECAADGGFEITLGPDATGPNTLRTTAGSYRVTIRQFFADWLNEEPMRARIDRLSAQPQPPAPLTTERLRTGLADAARWVNISLHYWAEMLDRWQRQPHIFLSYRQLDDNAIDATPGGEPLIAYWKVKPGQALLIRVTPPRALYWNVEFGNYWWETMDYRYRHAGTNCHHADLEAGGELIVVISHDDPGLPNWLDPAGHEEGYITYRWIGADTWPRPECTLLDRDALQTALPPTARRIDSAERARRIAERRIGVLKRFGY